MGLRYRKTVSLLPGFKMNISGGGVSFTAGVPGASINIGKRGVYSNAGIPGTGLSYRQRIGGPTGSSASDPTPGSAALNIDPSTVAVAETMADSIRAGVSLDELWYCWHSVTLEQAAAFFAQHLRKEMYPRKRVLECADGQKRSLSAPAFALAGQMAAQDMAEALGDPKDPLDGAAEELRAQVLKVAADVHAKIEANPSLRTALQDAARSLAHAAKSYGLAVLGADKIVEALKFEAQGDAAEVEKFNTEVMPLFQQHFAWKLIRTVREEDERRAIDRIHSEGGKTVSERQEQERSAATAKVLLLIAAIIIAVILAAVGAFNSSGKTVHVRGYTRSDGTSVSGYDRRK